MIVRSNLQKHVARGDMPAIAATAGVPEDALRRWAEDGHDEVLSLPEVLRVIDASGYDARR